ncbi:MAG: YdeI/OmpD-associated family protein [Candidatus Dormibacteraeota bacterium]|nr:YdeI/OmpD-associated family protein [Candidatus Dormibacteraeota bacterium]
MAEVFTARIGGEGDDPLPESAVTMIEVPPRVVETLGRGKRPPVLVTVNGYTWRSTPAVYDGRFYLPVNKANRTGAKLELGDRVEVRLELDTAPREVEPPPALAKALAADAVARAAWDRLSFTNRSEHAEAIRTAKQEETRARRLAKLLDSLRAK